MKKGFTLVEIAIVLVIIGILIGGLVAGRSMIKAANVQAAVADYQKFSAAANNFKDKYGYYPGDMANADEYWNVAAATSGNIKGDGNGLVDNAIATTPATTEANAYWLHLSKSGFISGTYTGASGYTAGTTVPRLPSGLIYAASSNYYFITAAAAWSGIRGTEIATNTNYAITIPQVLGSNAYAIDAKMDNGAPLTGFVRSDGSACCSSTSYNISSSTAYCATYYYPHTKTQVAWTSCN